jgi:hypothetical protein
MPSASRQIPHVNFAWRLSRDLRFECSGLFKHQKTKLLNKNLALVCDIDLTDSAALAVAGYALAPS